MVAITSSSEKIRSSLLYQRERFIDAYENKGKYEVSYYETVSKVMLVFSHLTVLLIPLAYIYLGSPANLWVPFGIGIPSFYAFGIISKKNRDKAEYLRRQYETCQLQQPLLSKHTYQLYPPGECDLPAIGSKADRLVIEEFGKSHPRSPADIKAVADRYHLDDDMFSIQQMAANTIAQDKEWQEVRMKVASANEAFRKGEIDVGVYRLERAKEMALKVGLRDDPTLNSTLSPHYRIERSCEEFNRLFGNLYLKKESLYNRAKAYSEELDADNESDKFNSFLKEFKNVPEKRINELSRDSEDIIEYIKNKKVTENVKKKASQYEVSIPEAMRKIILQYKTAIPELMKELNQLEKKLQKWIEKHPCERIAIYSKQLLAAEKREGISKEKIQQIAEACAKLEKFKEENGSYTVISEGLDVYKKEILDPAVQVETRVKTKVKEISLQEKIARIFKRKAVKPIQVVFPTLEEQTFFDRLNVQKVSADKICERQEEQILKTYFYHRVWLEVALVVAAVVIETFFPFFWLSWGFTAGMLVLGLGSVYLGNRIKKWHQGGQSLKLGNKRRSHPLITHVPGDRPILRDLQSVAGRMYLDGTTQTEAALRIEGESHLGGTTFTEAALDIKGEQAILKILKKDLRKPWQRYETVLLDRLNRAFTSAKDRREKDQELYVSQKEVLDKMPVPDKIDLRVAIQKMKKLFQKENPSIEAFLPISVTFFNSLQRGEFKESEKARYLNGIGKVINTQIDIFKHKKEYFKRLKKCEQSFVIQRSIDRKIYLCQYEWLEWKTLRDRLIGEVQGVVNYN